MTVEGKIVAANGTARVIPEAHKMAMLAVKGEEIEALVMIETMAVKAIIVMDATIGMVTGMAEERAHRMVDMRAEETSILRQIPVSIVALGHEGDE